MDEEEARVAGTLDTLGVLHYVYAGLHLMGCLGGILLVAVGGVVMRVGKEIPAGQPTRMDPEQVTEFVGGFYAVLGGCVALFALAGGIACFLAGGWLRSRRNATFCTIVAAIECLNVPLGTVLGIFTLITLQKPEARALFDRSSAEPR